jgi:hypothetical protein
MNTMCKQKLRAKITIQSDNCKNRDVHNNGGHDSDKSNDNNDKL